MQEQVAALLPKREGRFVFESGHQGAIWLETLASFPSLIFEPAACPLCAKGVPRSA